MTLIYGELCRIRRRHDANDPRAPMARQSFTAKYSADFAADAMLCFIAWQSTYISFHSQYC